MILSEFIRTHSGLIAGEWMKSAEAGSPALRDRVGDILLAAAERMEEPGEEKKRSLARGLVCTAEPLTLAQLVSEFCSLRATVLRVWADAAQADAGAAARFERALDELLLDSVQALVQQQDESMNRSLAVLGHDLRNSLGAISMSASVLSRSPGLPQELAKPVGGILSTVARMKHMVGDLDDLARVRLAGGMPIARAGVDIEPVCRRVLQEIQTVYPDFSIRFQASGDLSGNWDGERIGQALGNVVRHAAQYGSFREPIAVSAEGRPDEVVFAVRNRGLPRPIQPPYGAPDPLRGGRPGEAASRDGTTGFRLTLYIAGEIMAAHGGTMEISSSENEGTIFTLRLPRR